MIKNVEVAVMTAMVITPIIGIIEEIKIVLEGI